MSKSLETFPECSMVSPSMRESALSWCIRKHDGGVVRGRERHPLPRDGHVVGDDPLAALDAMRPPSEPGERIHERARYPGMSMYDTETGEVAAFEELVGCHGDWAGPQTQPFVLHPAQFAAAARADLGAAALHQTLKSWRNLAAAPDPAVENFGLTILVHFEKVQISRVSSPLLGQPSPRSGKGSGDLGSMRAKTSTTRVKPLEKPGIPGSLSGVFRWDLDRGLGSITGHAVAVAVTAA